MPKVFITDPPNGTTIPDPTKPLTIVWSSDPSDAIIRWKLYLGTEDGRWDLLMSEQDTRQQITLDPEEYPLGRTLYAQVRGVYMGSTTTNGKKHQEEERALSEIVVWNPSNETTQAS